MKSIILAAGRGSRLKDLTSNQPKCMVKLKGRPLIDYQISALCDSGIEDVAVVVGYLKEKVSHPKIVKFFENRNWKETNMVSSLFEAAEWLEKYDCVVSYSDIFYTDLAVKKLVESSDELAITYDKNFAKLWSDRFPNPLDDLESFKIDAQNYLTEIGKKVSDISEVEGQYMGLVKITPSGWRRIKDVLKDVEVEKIDMTKMLNLLVQYGVKIKAIAINDQWGEVDSISDLKLYEDSCC